MNRNVSLDILKLILAYMVVGFHAGFLEDVSPLGNYLTVNGLFRAAVPVFFVINGFFFYSTLKINPVNWFKRIIILYVFWMFFYSYFWFRPSEFNVYELAKLLKTIVLGYHHLWYLSALIGAAVTLCIFKNLSSKALLSLSVGLFSIGLIIQYFCNYYFIDNKLADEDLSILWIYRSFLLFAFPFFCIGYLLKKTEIYKNIRSVHLLFAMFFGLLFLFAESYLNFNGQVIPEGFDILASLLFFCPFIFLTFLSLTIPGNGKSIALYSTVIYFIHPFFISLLGKYSDIRGTGMTIIVAILSTLCAAFIVKVYSRFPFMLKVT